MHSIASFSGANGSGPQGAVVLDAGGDVFGTTIGGGRNSDGDVFEIAAASGSITDLADFNVTNGAGPQSAVVLDSSGDLFGTTESGGAINDGDVFEVVSGSGTITDVVDFSGANGANPFAGLVLDSKGDLFGSAPFGGANGDGDVFEIVAGSSKITDLVDFSGANGQNPYAGVVLDSKGDLFGVSRVGGANGDGDVFEVVAGSGKITDLADFNGTNGQFPVAAVVLDTSGDVFGTTSYGGAQNDGVVFEVVASSGKITDLAAFNGRNGANPQGAVALDSNGDLFGTALNGGLDGDGDVWEVPAGASVVADVADFNVTNGQNPYGGVTLDSSGDLFGTTGFGGAHNDGVVFELTPTSKAIVPQRSVAGRNGDRLPG
jgi:uncharacterized repeat protein (TIGR03803 family)